MFSAVKSAFSKLVGASVVQNDELRQLRIENDEVRKENEEIKGMLKELLKRKREDDTEETQEVKPKKVHVDVPAPVPSSSTNASLPLPASLIPPSLLSQPSSTPLAPVSMPPPPSSSSSPIPASSFVVSTGGGNVDLNANNQKSNNQTTQESNNQTQESNNTSSSHNTTVTNNNEAADKKLAMISFQCATMTKFAEMLSEALKKTNKFDVFCCTQSLKLGLSFRPQIAEAAVNSKVFICLLNQAWAESWETLSEYLVKEKLINTDKDNKVRLIPIVFNSDDNAWQKVPMILWILSKYQGYFIDKDDAKDATKWKDHIDKCVGMLCQE
jgi:hypothetical protein